MAWRPHRALGMNALTVALLIFLAGVTVRYLYIIHWHPAEDYLYSDMKSYYASSFRLLNPSYEEGIRDTIHPPGTQYFFAGLMRLEMWWKGEAYSRKVRPPLNLVMFVQFGLSALVPLLLAGIASDLWSRRVALWVLGASSLYFPFFDYAGYLLSEAQFLFFMVLSFWLLVRAIRVKGRLSYVLGASAGISLGLSASFKTVSLVGAALMLVLLLVYVKRGALRAKRAITTSLVGFLVVLSLLAVRATNLSGGFSLIANDASRNVLMGHYGTFKRMTFTDSRTNSTYRFGSPAHVQRAYRRTVEIPYGVTQNRELLELALDWTLQHPAEALSLSVEHVFDLIHTYPWPSIASPPTRVYAKLFHYAFHVFLLIPAWVHVLRYRRELLTLQPHMCGDALLIMPLFGIMIAAFIAIGEARYRVPFDAFTLLLAARFYCGMRTDENRLAPGSD